MPVVGSGNTLRMTTLPPYKCLISLMFAPLNPQMGAFWEHTWNDMQKKGALAVMPVS
ncbi:hypothetical protein METHP15_60001 [Pseudomonas sp. P15-2025]